MPVHMYPRTENKFYNVGGNVYQYTNNSTCLLACVKVLIELLSMIHPAISFMPISLNEKENK